MSSSPPASASLPLADLQPGQDPHNPHALTPPQRVYLWLVSVNVTCLLLANIIGAKLFQLELDLAAVGLSGKIPVEHTMGMLPFPITFLLTDLVNEYFGRRAARRMAYVSFSMAALTWVLIYVSRMFPTLEGIPGTATDAAFENIFGAAAVMYLASIIAFLLASLLDIYLFSLLKRLTGGRLVWLRTTGSTVISQVFDSLLITFLFFFLLPRLMGNDSATLTFVIQTAATGYILKFVIAVVLTPAVYAGRWAIRRLFGMTPLPASEA